MLPEFGSNGVHTCSERARFGLHGWNHPATKQPAVWGGDDQLDLIVRPEAARPEGIPKVAGELRGSSDQDRCLVEEQRFIASPNDAGVNSEPAERRDLSSSLLSHPINVEPTADKRHHEAWGLPRAQVTGWVTQTVDAVVMVFPVSLIQCRYRTSISTPTRMRTPDHP